MRFKLKLQVCAGRFGRELPINYQYECSAVIYHILSRSGSRYSGWLHQNGFQTENKRFKLFTFSHLIVPRYGIDKDRQRLIVQSDTVEWYISFLPEESTQNFIEGVFKEQYFQIGDKVSAVEFFVKEVCVMPGMEYKEEMYFETLSPVCVSKRRDDGKTDYISPRDKSYVNGILTGLLARYNAFYGKEYEGPLDYDFQVLTEPKSVLVKIKADTSQQTFVRGYKYRFKIKLPEPLMKIMYESGIGEKGSTGWGMIKEIIPNIY